MGIPRFLGSLENSLSPACQSLVVSQQGSDPVLYLKEGPRAKGIFTKDLNGLQRNQLGGNSLLFLGLYVRIYTHMYLYMWKSEVSLGFFCLFLFFVFETVSQ